MCDRPLALVSEATEILYLRNIKLHEPVHPEVYDGIMKRATGKRGAGKAE